jgi:DNA transformation protein and related proteins
MAGDSFQSFVLDQLSALPELRARAMFGGHGLYSGELFFGILYRGRVYLKVNGSNRAEFEARGMSLFSYEVRGEVKTMNYFEVPPDVLEDRHEAVAWARRALSVASSQKSARSNFKGGKNPISQSAKNQRTRD